MLHSLDTHVAAVLGRRWRVYLLWYAEGCVGFAAVWTLVTGTDMRGMLTTGAYLLLCAVILTVPVNALRSLLVLAGVRPDRRRLVLEVTLALSAAATATTLGTSQAWAGIVCILLTGNALWALEMDLRDGQPAAG